MYYQAGEQTDTDRLIERDKSQMKLCKVNLYGRNLPMSNSGHTKLRHLYPLTLSCCAQVGAIKLHQVGTDESCLSHSLKNNWEQKCV